MILLGGQRAARRRTVWEYGVGVKFPKWFLRRLKYLKKLYTGTMRPSWGAPGTSWTWGDDPDDQVWINRGVNYFESGAWNSPLSIGSTSMVMSLLAGATRLAFLLLLFTPKLAEAGPHYRYVGGLGDGIIEIWPPNGANTKGDWRMAFDSFLTTVFCDSRSAYICFDTGAYAFAVPRHLTATHTEWRYRKVHYRVVQRDLTVELLGKKLMA